jgi:hypothetical protein
VSDIAGSGRVGWASEVADKFKPTLSFVIGEGWRTWEPETTNRVFIVREPGVGQLIFTAPLHDFDPSQPSQQEEVPAPNTTNGWVSWFEKHPNLDI